MYRHFPDQAAGSSNTRPPEPIDDAREAAYRLACTREVVSGGRLLDVGCGRGEFLKAARDAFEVVGLDVARRMESSESIPFIEGRVEDTRFDDGTFRAVTAFEVLEHLFDPGSMLRETRRILCSNGTFLFQTGDLDSLRPRLNLGSWPYVQPPVHLNIFSRKGLEILMRKTGFRIVRSWSFGRATQRVPLIGRLPDPEIFRPFLNAASRIGLIGCIYAADKLSLS